MYYNCVDCLNTLKVTFVRSHQSVHNYDERLAFSEKHHFTRLKASLHQLSLMCIGPKLGLKFLKTWKSASSFAFGQQYKNLLFSCQNAS